VEGQQIRQPIQRFLGRILDVRDQTSSVLDLIRSHQRDFLQGLFEGGSPFEGLFSANWRRRIASLYRLTCSSCRSTGWIKLNFHTDNSFSLAGYCSISLNTTHLNYRHWPSEL